MVASSPTPEAPSLALFRTSHRIKVVDRDYTRCAVDMVRVHAVKGGWRHDSAELAGLIRAEYGGTWPSRRVAEDAVAAAVASDIAREDAFERGTLTFDLRVGNQSFGVGLDVSD